MTSKKSTSTLRTVEYNGFGGMDRSEAFSGKGCLADVVNFRVCPDGSLKKRHAAVKMATLNSKPRAYRELDGGNALLLMNNRFGILNTESFTFSTVITVGTISGDAHIFCYAGKTLLLDGSELYVYENDTLTAVEGYAPLYGKDWDPIKCGEINERQNLASPHLRISYLIKNGSPTRFMFGLSASSIDAVYLNGVKVSAYQFPLEDGSMSASCGMTLADGDEITFCLTADGTESSRDMLTTSTRAAIFGAGGDRGADPSSVAFYREGSSAQVICTRRIDAYSFKDTLSAYPNAIPLYVTADDILTVGDGTAPINAVRRRGDRLLLFTLGETYALAESGGASSLSMISSYAGCSAKGAALSIQDSPVTVSEIGVLVWSPVSYDGDEYVAKCISHPIEGAFSEQFYSSTVAHLHRSRGELWFSDPSSDDKRIFIYNTLTGHWYSYSGISADSFFDAGGRIGFFSGRDAYVFDDSATEDTSDEVTTPIIASLTTGTVDFGDRESSKRLCKLSLTADPDTELDVTVKDALGNTVESKVTSSHGEGVGYADLRLSVPRSMHYTVTVTSPPSSSGRLRSLKLTATE